MGELLVRYEESGIDERILRAVEETVSYTHLDVYKRQVVCPRGAISTVNGKSVIDQSKCIRCGKCKSVCPYDAVSHQQRPCSAACGVGAIGSDGAGRAVIDSEKCVTCGQCMVCLLYTSRCV